MVVFVCGFFFQAEDGIRDLVRSRGLGDVYKRQVGNFVYQCPKSRIFLGRSAYYGKRPNGIATVEYFCLLYTSDAADERSSVDLGGRRIIKKKKNYKLRKSTVI